MTKIPVIAIFDVGKTNKKILLFDEQYEIVHQVSKNFDEIIDEDGFPCEDVNTLSNWLSSTFGEIIINEKFMVKAINFSAYGASFVYLNDEDKVFLPLYNYLKPFPKPLQDSFYNTYGGESMIARQTASPVLGNLNSGMQLFRLKYEKPEQFEKIRYALHLPQYLSFILTGSKNTELTSIGCHTSLWNFQNNDYHSWVKQESIEQKFPTLKECSEIAGYTSHKILVGVGLHDSSAALIPYITAFKEPFILLSTGTWCISLNPFNHSLLTDYELHQDCLCYLSYKGRPVKASRLFAGNEHEQQVKLLAEYFNTNAEYYKQVKPDFEFLKKNKPVYDTLKSVKDGVMVGQSQFGERDLAGFKNYDEAYSQLICDILEQQVRSTNIVLKGTSVQRIFVDGGFSKNSIYMYLLSEAYPGIEVYAASVAQASSLGAAMVMHQHWNTKELPADIIQLKLYSGFPQNSL